MPPSQEWLAQYHQLKSALRPPHDLTEYFNPAITQIAGKAIDHLNVGSLSLPSGQVLVRDPLVYLHRDEPPYFLAVPAGEYQAELCVVKPDDGDCARYAALQTCLSNAAPVYFEEALIGTENLTTINDGNDFFGFNVDAGLACIADTVTRDAFCDFSDQWHQKNPGKNLYDDYFAALFAASYQQHPHYQREGGDWLRWQIPGTAYHLIFVQSGFGDGTYPVYFGFDANGAICRLVVQFIDIVYAYSDEEA